MKVVSVRDFRDRATEMLRSEDIVLITRDGRPTGFFVPWNSPDIPADVRHDLFSQAVESGVESPEFEPDLEALREAAGGWEGIIDGQELLEEIYESRRTSRRPPARL